jgi:16S rRNA (guanine527-N7)-methyltransferase
VARVARSGPPTPAPPAPSAEAVRVFGPALPAAVAYAELLTGAGVDRGLVGPAEAPRIWDRHLVNCAVVAELVPAPTRVVADVGSGAGLPGMVLAIMLPAAAVVLVEPMARRVTFLHECARELGLANVEIRRGRAEDLAGNVQADVVTARAVAALDRLVGLTVGLARPGGLVLAIKGEGAAAELERAMPALLRAGVTDAEIVAAGSGVISRPTTVVRFRAPERAGGPGRPGGGVGGRGGGGAGGRGGGQAGGRGGGHQRE